MTNLKLCLQAQASALAILACVGLTAASAEPINNSGLSAQECYQKDSGCTQFCGEVTGDLRYECFGICDRMLNRCLDTGDWSDSRTIEPGDHGPRRSLTVLSAGLLQMVMSLADTDGDGFVSAEEIKSVKEKLFKGQVTPGASGTPAAPVQ